MNDTTSTDSTSAVNTSVSGPMTLDLWTASTNIQPKEYVIAPEDQHIADTITAKHPVYDVPGPVEASGDVKLPSRLSVTMLPPHLAEPIRDRLEQASPINRDALEQQLVGKAVEDVAFSLRLDAGIASSNDSYWKERFAVARQEKSLSNEADTLVAEMAAVTRVEAVFDDAGFKTGERSVFKLEGDARNRAERRLIEIDRELKALTVEGPRRFAKALHDAVEDHKATADKVALHAEIDRRTKEQVREQRINDAVSRRVALSRNAS